MKKKYYLLLLWEKTSSLNGDVFDWNSLYHIRVYGVPSILHFQEFCCRSLPVSICFFHSNKFDYSDPVKSHFFFFIYHLCLMSTYQYYNRNSQYAWLIKVYRSAYVEVTNKFLIFRSEQHSIAWNMNSFHKITYRQTFHLLSVWMTQIQGAEQY